jgi:hypothetical protein
VNERALDKVEVIRLCGDLNLGLRVTTKINYRGTSFVPAYVPKGLIVLMTVVDDQMRKRLRCQSRYYLLFCFFKFNVMVGNVNEIK